MSTIAPRSSKWARKPVGDVFDVIGGGTPSKQESSYYGGGIPWATIRDMQSSHLSSTEHSITERGLANSSSKLIPAGEVIMASRVGLGKASILMQDTAINQDIRALIPQRNDSVDRRFLLYWLQSVADEIVAAGMGATVQGVTLPFIKGLSFPIVSIDEQKRIVAKLDQAFAALDGARVNAEANLADARGLQAQALEDVLSDPELGECEPCGSHVDLLSGFAFKSAGYSVEEGDIRLVRGDNIVQGGFRWSGVMRWPESDRAAYHKYELAKGDVLVAMDRTWVSAGIKYAVVDEEALPSLLVQRVARLRALPSLLPAYLAAWIGSPLFERYVLSIQTGLGVPHVSGGQIESFEMRVPSLGEQSKVVRKLGEVLRGCAKLSMTYERNLADIAALRQSMLHAAFSDQLT
ncbi:MAG: restriction endonuclease subunit S [Pseudoxanthomonas sp.]